jgi:hypothetical protein
MIPDRPFVYKQASLSFFVFFADFAAGNLFGACPLNGQQARV